MTSAPAVVTVIVPGFDVEDYAAEAIESLRAQTLTTWRAILVDDASSDDTGRIFAEAAATDNRFHVLTHDRRRGLGAARNAALDLVDTEFLAFLDADDIMRPGALKRLVGVLHETGSDFVAGAYVRLRPTPLEHTPAEHPPAEHTPALPVSTTYTAGDVQPWVAAATSPERRGTTLEQHPEATSNIVAWSKVSRADFWTRAALRFPEGRLYEDQLVAQQMYTRAVAFDVVPDVVVDWRVRADGSSITQREAALPVLHESLRAMLDGLNLLQEGAYPNAALARRRQIARMDVPRLAGIAADHPHADYRAALAEFTAEIWPDAAAIHRDDLEEASITAITTISAW